MSEYKVWFGKIYEKDSEFEVRKCDDLVQSFEESKSEKLGKLPFSLKEVGIRVFKSEEDYYFSLRRTAIQVAEKEVEKELKGSERYLISLLKALDEIDLGINLFSEKIRDLEEIKIDENTENFRRIVRDLKKLRRDIEDEINSQIAKLMPNMSEIVGGIIAARLIEKAGSLKKLSSLPASTIQILGAEKSLFKAMSRMKKGKKAKTPKHGIIFQHPFIRTLPKSLRGKMARFLASKLAIAARIDYYSGELKEELFESVKRKYEELRETSKTSKTSKAKSRK
ncbi:RNA-processing protein [Archaeoglobales archaeon]|nr:MAG: RNA-processing protein [Archaeoglobales archaeon]